MATVPETPSALALQVIAALHADIVVVCPPGRLDVMTSTMAGIFTKETMIGFDLPDLLAPARHATGGLGRAMVVDGIVSEADAGAVAAWFATVWSEGRGDAGPLIVQSVTVDDYGDWALSSIYTPFVAFLDEVFGSPDFGATTVTNHHWRARHCGPDDGLHLARH